MILSCAYVKKKILSRLSAANAHSVIMPTLGVKVPRPGTKKSSLNFFTTRRNSKLIKGATLSTPRTHIETIDYHTVKF